MEMVIRGGKIFDAVHREPYSADIWVKDGKIAQIGGDFAASAGAEVVDASGTLQEAQEPESTEVDLSLEWDGDRWRIQEVEAV